MKIVQFTTDNREPYGEHAKPEPWFGAAPNALLQGFAERKDIEVHVISCVREPVANPSKIFGSIHYHSVVVPKHGWLSTLYQGCIRSTRKLVREINPDIVHGQGTERECSMCAVYSGYPNVVTIHGNMAELNRLGDTFHNNRGYGFLVSRLESHTIRKTSGVLCNSAYTQSLVAPLAKRTWRVPNSIRSAFLSSPRSKCTETDVPIFLNVGQVGPRKRQLEVLNALTTLHEEGFKFRIVFAGASGDDPYGRAFRCELEKVGKFGFAHYVGFLGEADLIQLMDESNGFIHFPSEEAFGLVVAEAMARGLKFFGSKVGGITEIAKGVPGAELHDSFPALQQGIRTWLNQGHMGYPEALQAISRRYSPKAVAKQHLDIYHDLIDR